MEVVLVDKKGNKLGLMDKLNAHANPGFLHRAISVVLYKKTPLGIEILIQKRAASKPLWPLVWANTVCTHPLDNETFLDCAVRRLKEEVRIVMKKQNLRELYTFYYQADYNDVFSEHEMDTVVMGEYSGEFSLNLNEAVEAKWVPWKELVENMANNRNSYTPWFHMIVKDTRVNRELEI